VEAAVAGGGGLDILPSKNEEFLPLVASLNGGSSLFVYLTFLREKRLIIHQPIYRVHWSRLVCAISVTNKNRRQIGRETFFHHFC